MPGYFSFNEKLNKNKEENIQISPINQNKIYVGDLKSYTTVFSI